MSRILVSNDDGVASPGLGALVAGLLTEGHEVWVSAPDRERSAQGHALTLHKPLRADPIRPGWWSVSGTPADCVYLALHGLLVAPPDLVVSGVNRGANVGHDVFYSGTVAAAMEAALHGVPAIAISLDVPPGRGRAPRWEQAVGVACELVREVLADPLPVGILLNLNVPDGDLRGRRVVPQGIKQYASRVDARTDPRGRPYYWIGGDRVDHPSDEATDAHLLADGYATLTPVHADLTHHPTLTRFAGWAARPG